MILFRKLSEEQQNVKIFSLSRSKYNYSMGGLFSDMQSSTLAFREKEGYRDREISYRKYRG